MEALGKLKPVFKAGGSVTAGNSSQTSDGASFVLVMSERMVKELPNLTPKHAWSIMPQQEWNRRIVSMGTCRSHSFGTETSRTQTK